jgi:hypothetical protein
VATSEDRARPLTPATAIYDLDYFSGAQMFLYIGDVWIDEVTSLSYECRQDKSPIYGYASQLWDDCAAGHVIVMGQFSINYKEQGYLWAVLNRNKKLSSGGQGARPGYGANSAMNITRQSVERVLQGNATRGEMSQFYVDLAGYASYDEDVYNSKTGQFGKGRDTTFENVVEEFEDAIWTKSINNAKLEEMTRRTDDNMFDGFDIYVVFGNYMEPKANHTVQKIIDVRLTSQSKLIKIDGEPVQEVYQFIAQTVA